MKKDKIFFTTKHQLRTVNNFTGQASSLNANLGLKDGSSGYYYSAFANANGGPLTIIREKDKIGPAFPYNYTIRGVKHPEKITVMNADGSDVQSYDFVRFDYKGQEAFIPMVDLMPSWNGPVLRPNEWKVNTTNGFPWSPSVNNPNRAGSPTSNGTGTTSPGYPSANPPASTLPSAKWSTGKIFGVTAIAAVAAGALFVVVKKIINRKK